MLASSHHPSPPIAPPAAPEVLWGSGDYSPAIDLWGVGCILGELLAGGPLFPGRSDIDQAYRLVVVLGHPRPEAWPVRRAAAGGETQEPLP